MMHGKGTRKVGVGEKSLINAYVASFDLSTLFYIMIYFPNHSTLFHIYLIKFTVCPMLPPSLDCLFPIRVVAPLPPSMLSSCDPSSQANKRERERHLSIKH